MLIRRALALSALAIATAFAGDKAMPAGDDDVVRTQTLTLHQAIQLALQHNIDIQWSKTDIKLQDTQIRLAWGDFDPTLTLSSNYEFMRTPQNPTTITSADTAQQILLEQEALAQIRSATAALPTPFPLPSAASTPAASTNITGTSPVYIFQNEDIRNNLNVEGKTPLGTGYKVGVEVDHLRDTVLNLSQQYLPSDVFFAGLSIDQPLLQGFGYDANLAGVRIGRKNRQVSFNNWHQRVIDSVTSVMITYFDMTYAQDLMKVRQESMNDDQLLAKANQRRVDVGLMTPIDVRQAETEVSADQFDFLTAKNLLAARVADLKKLIYRGIEEDDGRTFVTAGSVDLMVPVLDRDALLADAYRNRVDYATAIQQAQIEDIRLKYYKNQLLPKIDFVATAGVNGLSTNSTAASISGGFGGQAPEWSFGIQGSIPFGNVAARANLAASRLSKEEALWKIKQVELGMNTDVDTAISSIRTNQQRVDAARQARKLAEEVVFGQNRRLEQGQASTLDIVEDRRRLYDAQSVELEAIDDLNKSIIQLYYSTGTILNQEAITLTDDEPGAPRYHVPHTPGPGSGGGWQPGQ